MRRVRPTFVLMAAVAFLALWAVRFSQGSYLRCVFWIHIRVLLGSHDTMA